MYRLVTGFVSHLMQKQEVRTPRFPPPWSLVGGLNVLRRTIQYSVLIMGLDNAGKTTLLGTSSRIRPDQERALI